MVEGLDTLILYATNGGLKEKKDKMDYSSSVQRISVAFEYPIFCMELKSRFVMADM